MIKLFLFRDGVNCSLAFLLNDEPDFLFLRAVYLFLRLWLADTAVE